ncbi:hypothetical protein [Clostridium sp.]|uniref:hypothetical protein n=1 Tax=Clostridium sp. TaxID=1506 RepID=UPI002612AECF|nr:hypothetical protein [Clostridium sp.]
MIQVFCASKGAGKTKRLIELANRQLKDAKGDSVYIDSNSRNRQQLKRNIRFINITELGILDFEGFYGLLCGIISQNYDVEKIYIDHLSNTLNLISETSSNLFFKLKEFSRKFNVDLFINVSSDNKEDIPYYLREYIA